ncbi:MAG: glycoside hydrolase [Bacteroidaceae bacterium]|nr:glycoside hydrolase [Bacteroidaceae bacterium]
MYRLKRTFVFSVLFIAVLTAINAQIRLRGYEQEHIAPEFLKGQWKAQWIGVPECDLSDFGVYHFRKTINLEQVPAKFIVHVSADNRYKLFVNDSLVALGPCRGDVSNWNYETIDLAPFLREGRNILASVVWFLEPKDAPVAQVSFGKAGFLMQGNSKAEAVVNTDKSWKCIRNTAYGKCTTGRVRGYYAAGATELIQAGQYPHGWAKADFDDSQWKQALEAGRAAAKGTMNYSERLLVPRSLPALEMTTERLKSVRKTEGIKKTGDFLKKPTALQIPAHTKAVLLLDQGYETTGYPHLSWTGGKEAKLTLTYAETLFTRNEKGHEAPLGDRNEVDNRVIFGYEDCIVADGNDFCFTPLWWRTWRYIQLTVETKEEPLTLTDMYGTFSAYPFKRVSQFAATGDDDLDKMLEVGWRTARLCAHETYMDCPYYEQLQYFGDTRIQTMVTMYNTNDMAMVRQALEMGRMSMVADGLTYSRYPHNVPQMISSYSLSWTGMIYDYWMYRGDDAYVRTLLPQTRSIMSWYEQYLREDGSLDRIPYWYFCDWASNFGGGEPIREEKGNSAYQDLAYLMALDEAAKMEEALGLPSIAQHYKELAARIRKDFHKKYWNEGRKMFADTYDHRNFSQHTNIMAILTNIVTDTEATALCERILAEKDITQTTIYFKYYLFLAMKHSGLANRYLDELGVWRQQLKENMTTWAEMPEPTRSDCHAWGAAPNIELFRIVLGIDTDAPRFGKVRITPALGKLTKASGTIPHPAGFIRVDYKLDKKGRLDALVELPAGISGTFVWDGKEYPLQAGTNRPLGIK